MNEQQDHGHQTRSRRRRRHRLLRSVALAITAVSLVVGAMLPAPAETPAIVLQKTSDARFEPRPDRPVFLLAIGTDFRPGVDGKRADALHLIGVNPRRRRATILNFPRDTWVPIPGFGSNKINASHTFGGPDLAARTIRQLTGARPDFVITTDFAGFTAMVDALGGVRVNVPFAMDEANSGAHFSAGRVKMDGNQALAFSRNRHIPDGDIRRSLHQGLVILSALAELRRDGRTPADTLRYLGVLYRHTVVVDVDPRELYELGRLALSIPPERIRNVAMPARIGSVGAQSVVFAGPGAASLFADFRDDAILERH